jgi:predicted ester cyclase
VAFRCRSDATFTGELVGLEPTGQRTGRTGMTIDRAREGRIVEPWHQWENTRFLRDIGALPGWIAPAGLEPATSAL